MPRAPRRVCNTPGCNKLADTGSFCGQHILKRQATKVQERKVYDNERGTAASRGYNSKWTRYSKKYREDNPLCVMCFKEGKIKLGGHVDHIIPVTGKDDPLFWDETNHQNLCRECHGRKTALEDGAFGNVKKER